MKSEISPEEDLQLLGLFTLAKGYAAKMEELRLAMCELLEVNPSKPSEVDDILDALYSIPIDPLAAKTQVLRRCGVVVGGDNQNGNMDKLP